MMICPAPLAATVGNMSAFVMPKPKAAQRILPCQGYDRVSQRHKRQKQRATYKRRRGRTEIQINEPMCNMSSSTSQAVAGEYRGTQGHHPLGGLLYEHLRPDAVSSATTVQPVRDAADLREAVDWTGPERGACRVLLNPSPSVDWSIGAGRWAGLGFGLPPPLTISTHNAALYVAEYAFNEYAMRDS